MNQLEPIQLEKLRQLDSCSIANAIERFGVRLRNTGFTNSSVRCIFPDFPPTVGYAATVRVRTSEPPMEGDAYYYRTDWLEHVLSIPAPRILVIQDMDHHPGLGSFIGDVHAHLLAAMGCIGVVTNGAVRSVDQAHSIHFQMFAGNLSVSHAFAHVLDFGTTVEVGHMKVRPGDLMHGDRHGIQTIPMEIAGKLSGVAQEMLKEELEIIERCNPAEVTLEGFREEVAALVGKRKASKV
jgi:4-hydroxy-4-methyl-2-oxoglutarate aldolase